MVEIEFDPEKEESNLAKHGISLGRAADFSSLRVVADLRFDYGEPRFRAWGLIDGSNYCFAFTIRSGRIRAISLRRAHQREVDRNVE